MRTGPARYVHASNGVTYLSLLAGLLAVVTAREWRSWSAAGGLIAVCALADTLDGRFARLFRRDADAQRFGVELDSLADALTFGLVPVVALYLLLTFDSVGTRIAWLGAAFLYVVSALTRLGYYDLHHADHGGGFVGLPTTVAGFVWSSAFLAAPSAAVTVGVLMGTAIAMVSSARTPRPRGLGLVAFGAWGVLLVVLHALAIAGEIPR